MRINKSTAITIDSTRLPAEGDAPLTLAEIDSDRKIPTARTFDIISVSMDRNILKYKKKHYKTIQLAGSSKRLSPAFSRAA